MAEKKRSSLGRSLSALLEEMQTAGGATGPSPSNPSDGRAGRAAGTPSDPITGQGSGASPAGLTTLPVGLIEPNPAQPRRRFDQGAMDELIASVRERGVLQPLLVRPKPGGGTYEIVAGERRWRAAQGARLHEVPVVVRALTDAEAFQIALIENIQRADLDPIEEAEGYRRLMEGFGHTQEELSKLVGKSRSHIANLLRTLDLPEPVRQLLAERKLTLGHAKVLASAPDPAMLGEMIAERGLSVRSAEELVSRMRAKTAGGGPDVTIRPRSAGPAKAGAAPADPDLHALEAQIEEALGIDARIDPRQRTLTLGYTTLDQLDMVLARLMGGGF